MKIAVFHEVNKGGARRAANEFSKSMKQMGHTVDLYCVDDNEDLKEMSFYSQMHVYLFHPIAWSGHHWKARLYRDTVELVKLCFLHKKIAEDIDSRHYDFVLVHPSKFTESPFVLRFLHTTTLYYCQEPLRIVYEPEFGILEGLDMFRTTYERATRYVRKLIDAGNAKKATAMISISKHIQRAVQRAYHLPSTICYMGVDTAIFHPTKSKSIDVLFIGTRDVNEGYTLFEEAKKLMKHQTARIQYLIRGENWTSNDNELNDLYSQSKIVICFGFNEPFGLIPIEAMASGAVPVALDEGGHRDTIKHRKTGMLVGRHPVEIAKTLDYLLENPEKLQEMRRAAIADMKAHWQWNVGTKQILSVYHRLKH